MNRSTRLTDEEIARAAEQAVKQVLATIESHPPTPPERDDR